MSSWILEMDLKHAPTRGPFPLVDFVSKPSLTDSNPPSNASSNLSLGSDHPKRNVAFSGFSAIPRRRIPARRPLD